MRHCLVISIGYIVFSLSQNIAYADTECPAGQYYVSASINGCTDVPAGYFAPESGYNKPIACPPGRYQPDAGATDCERAPVGKYAPWPATSSTLDDLPDCPQGSESYTVESMICTGTGDVNSQHSILYRVPTQIYSSYESQLLLQGRNEFDQEIALSNSDTITVLMVNGQGAAVTVTTLIENGEVALSFTALVAGDYALSTNINGVSGPSLTLTVLDSEINSDDDSIIDVLDVDDDNDGLIEIHSLSELHLILEDLNGTSLDGDETGCPDTNCIGYELVNDLDFDADWDGLLVDNDHWNNALGWWPLGDGAAGVFRAEFNGNGYSINNLFIQNTKNYTGLFGAMQNAIVSNLTISGPLTRVSGHNSVGLLVGRAEASTLSNIHVTGSVYGDSSIGGLAGFLYNSDLSASHANASVKGLDTVGALIGGASVAGDFSDLKQNYGAGTVSGDTSVGGLVGHISDYVQVYESFSRAHVSGINKVGGLVGSVAGGGGYGAFISYTYAKGQVTGTSEVGGLVGSLTDTTVTDSHWDIEATTQASSAQGLDTGLTSLQMTCPTGANQSCEGATSTYQFWDTGTSTWDYGNSSQYPVLTFNNIVQRDSDEDGVMDELDDFPNHIASSIDTDNDGFPDTWNAQCDQACIDQSGLELDSFPNDVAISMDSDGDGIADAFNEACDMECQTNSNLLIDAFPDDAAASVDDNNDGMPDEWNNSCDNECQKNSNLELETSGAGNSGGGSLPWFLISIMSAALLPRRGRFK